jgi:photosystem II stability/assembly factor-like uncharacterized protein
MSDRVMVATRKGLFTLARAKGWKVAQASFVGDRVAAICRDRERGTLWAAMDLGHFGAKLRRSDDAGATWTDVAVPKYPERPADADDVDPMRKTPIPWNLELLWTIEHGGRGHPDRLWAGTIPGGLFVSEDRGDSWRLIEPLWHHPSRRKWFGGGYDFPGIHSICVDPRDGDRVLLGISCGGVWQTPDAGASWSCTTEGMLATFMPPERQSEPDIQDPHRVVRCEAAPERLWTQHHCGVWRSDDGGRTWTRIEVPPSSFGFAVAVHPRDPDTAWFVPARADEQRVPIDGAVVVARTRDGGKSFEVLREGLPQEDAYDLVYRHALAVDASGDRLALGSTTGSVWVSEDGGDRFVAASEHLPPVNAVTFA